MANGQITGKETFSDDLFERIDRFVDGLDNIVKGFDQVEQKGKSATNSIAFADAERKNADAVKKANTALTERERLQRRVERQAQKIQLANSKIGREYAEQRVELLRLNREQRTQAIIINENERAYTRLSRRYNEAKKDLKDLIVTTGQYSPAAQKQAREVERLGQKIKTADNIAGDFQRNVGNYPSALRPALTTIRQLIGVFGIVEGIRFGFRLARDLSNIAREAKGVEFAFKRLGNQGRQSFDAIKERTKGLFSDLEVQQAIVEFDNFRLAGEELGTIFEFIAVRSAQTGKSFEFLRNSAIEAITKESILRADNLGISQAALNQELDKGVDFLTAFGNVARREINRAGDILDEAANGGQKFSASLENIKVAAGQNINTFQGFSVVNDFLDRTNDLVRLQGEFLNGNISLIDRLKAGFGLLSGSRAEENKELLSEIENRRKLTEELKAQAEAYGRLNNQVGAGPVTEQQANGAAGFDFLAGPQEETVRTLETINAELQQQQEIFNNIDANDKKRLRTVADKINALERERKAILDLIEPQKEANKAQQEFISNLDTASESTFQIAISNLKGLRAELEVGSDQYKNITRDIENLEKALDGLKNGFDLDNIDFIDPNAAQDAIDVDNFLNTEGIELAAKQLAGSLKQTQEELLAEYDSLYERDYQNFLKWAKEKTEAEIKENDRRLEVQQELLSIGQDFAQAFFEIQSNRIEDEIEKQNEAFDAVVNNKNASEEQIRIAEIKRAENEKKLQEEREKRQRRAFLLAQAFEVAKVALADATARANATATSFLLPPIAAQAYLASAQGTITTNTALAIAAILAQSIPQFFKGKNYTDKYEGPATWGERGREVRIGTDGNVEVSPNGTTMTYVKKDDIITPSVSAFHRSMQNPSSEVFKRVVGEKYTNDTNTRLRVVQVSSGESQETAKLLKETNRLLKRQGRRPINVTSKVVIDKPSKYFAS